MNNVFLYLKPIHNRLCELIENWVSTKFIPDFYAYIYKVYYIYEYIYIDIYIYFFILKYFFQFNIIGLKKCHLKVFKCHHFKMEQYIP